MQRNNAGFPGEGRFETFRQALASRGHAKEQVSRTDNIVVRLGEVQYRGGVGGMNFFRFEPLAFELSEEVVENGKLTKS